MYDQRIERTIQLDMTKGTKESILFVQGDQGTRFLRTELVDDGQPFSLIGSVVNLRVEKPDGEDLFLSGTVEDRFNGVVLFEMTLQSLLLKGKHHAQVKVVSDLGEVKSKIFTYEVQESLDDEGIESSSEFTALTEALKKVIEFDPDASWDNSELLESIDTLNERITTVETHASSEINALKNQISSLDSGVRASIDDLTNKINQVESETRQLMDTILHLIGGGGLTTSNQTIIGAINELKSMIENYECDCGGSGDSTPEPEEPDLPTPPKPEEPDLPTPPEPEPEPEYIPVTGITVDEWDVKLKVRETRQMIASVIPSHATNKTIHWKSSYSSIATVSSTGLISAKSEGYTLVSATTDDGQFSYNIHVNVSGFLPDNGDDDNNNDYDNDVIEMPDSALRNKVPYLSTYEVEHTIPTGTDLQLSYFVTDFYGRSYTKNSDFYKYKIIVRCDGKDDQVLTNVSAGEHTINLGSFNQEGTYHYSIVARDQYGRYSHELFNYVRVKNDTSHSKTYYVTAGDLTSQGITYNMNREIKQFVNVVSAGGDTSAINSLINTAYNNTTVPSGKYICFIPDREGNGVYQGINKDWDKIKVKYASDYNKTSVANECVNNRKKIQALLEKKVGEGYNHIVMYKATYVVDNVGFEIPSGLDFDMNGSTFKTNPFTGNGALIAKMTDAIDTHVHNGVFEGDYFAHDYANSTNNSEWVSGFEMGGSCRYSSLYDVTIKDITGYGLQNSISNTSSNGTSFFPPVVVGDKVNGFELGDLDPKTGQEIECSYRTRTTDFTNISGAIGKSDFLTVSIHLNYQGNEFDSFNMVVYFYDSSRNFIKAVNAYQYRQIKIPTGAYYARTVFLGLRQKSDWNVHYHFLRVPTHCRFENVTIDNARCVGMAQGQMKDFVVKDCTITNSGQSSATCAYDAEDGWDGMQDVFFYNFDIKKCPHNGFLTCAGHNFVVDNMTSDGMYMWERSRWVEVKNSTFGGVAIRGGGEKDILKHGIARFYNNTVNGLFYQLNFVSNILKNCNLPNDLPQSGILMGCTVKGSYIDKQVVNRDSNNPCVDDYGTYENMDTNQSGGGSNGGGSTPTYGNIIVSTYSLNVEVGTSTTFTVKLDSQPTNNQTVTISAGSHVTVSPSTLTFTRSNWSQPQTITVRGSSKGTPQITVSSSNVNSQYISVTVTESSSGGGATKPTMTPSSATMAVGSTQIFTLSGTDYKIRTTYTANDRIGIKQDSGTQVTVTAKSEGQAYLNVILTDDSTSFSIPIMVTSSGSSGGSGGNGGSTTPTYGNIVTSSTSLSVNAGSSTTLRVRLSQAPSNNQTVAISASGGISIYPSYLTFTSSNWYTEQTITITGTQAGGGTITLSSSNTNTIYVNVSVNGTSGGGSNSGGTTEESFDSSGRLQIAYPATKKSAPNSWNALGDSITFGTGAGGNSYSYANVCASSIGVRNMSNYGIPGSCVNDGYNLALTDVGYETAFCNRYTQMVDGAELITVLGSVNDHRADSKIGDKRSTSTKDFHGALRVLVDGLKSKYPSGRIVLITPFKIGGWDGKNMYGHTILDFRNAIVRVANEKGIEVVDLFSVEEFAYVKSPQTGYFTYGDWYHPTVSGHLAIANYLKEQLFGESGGSTSPSNEYAESCTSSYILDKMYPMGQSHEAIPSGLITDTWKYNSRWENQYRPSAVAHGCGVSNCPQTGAFQALGCWSNVYRVEGTSFTQNTGVEMKDIKVYGWYNGAWELVQHLPIPDGNFYAESFGGDASKHFSDSVKTSSNSKTIILREANKIQAMNWNTGELQTENCMYHPFSKVKKFDTKYQYIYTCIDLRKVKWDANGVDDRDATHYCSNCGGDWWLAEGLLFHDSWQHNKGVCQPKMIEITNEWRRFSMTTVPQSWSNGFPS